MATANSKGEHMSKILRVAHYPQIPCKAFYVDVDTVEEAVKTMDTLANYDLFQLENRIKPDFCNMNVLQEFDIDEGEWLDWCDGETGIDDPREYLEFIKTAKE